MPAIKLPRIDEADIEARCTSQSYSRGRSYYRGNAIFALLLTRVDAPDQFSERPPVDELLTPKNKEELVALIDRY